MILKYKSQNGNILVKDRGWMGKQDMLCLTSSLIYQYRDASFRTNQYFFHFCEK
jgi:hypothetical protein